MFNRSVNARLGPNFPSEVTKDLAPTADHVRLLGELEERFKKRVVQKIVVNAPRIQFVVFVAEGGSEFQHEAFSAIRLNGEVFIHCFSVGRNDSREQIVRKALNGVAEEVAREMMYVR